MAPGRKSRLQDWLEKRDRSNQIAFDAMRPPKRPTEPALVLEARTNGADPVLGARLHLLIDNSAGGSRAVGVVRSPAAAWGAPDRDLPRCGRRQAGFASGGSYRYQPGASRSAPRLPADCLFGFSSGPRHGGALRSRCWPPRRRLKSAEGAAPVATWHSGGSEYRGVADSGRSSNGSALDPVHPRTGLSAGGRLK